MKYSDGVKLSVGGMTGPPVEWRTCAVHRRFVEVRVVEVVVQGWRVAQEVEGDEDEDGRGCWQPSPL